MPNTERNPSGGLMHGMALGRTEAGLERLICIGEMHGRSLELIATTQAKMAAALELLETRTQPPLTPKEPVAMPWRDRIQLAVFVLAALAVLLGKLPIKEALILFGKPWGF